MSQQEATATGEGSSTAARVLSARSRRKTVFYEPAVPAEKEIFRVPKGSGTRLRDIPAISATLAKCRAEEPLLQDIHRILFKRTGIKTKRKRDIGDFSGFSFARGEKVTETEKLRERVVHSRGLRKLVDFFGIPVKTGKEKMTDAIVEFLMKPTDLSEEKEEPPPKKETPKKRLVKKVTVSRKRKSEDINVKTGTNAKRLSKRREKESMRSKVKPKVSTKKAKQQESAEEAGGQKPTDEDAQPREEECNEAPDRP